MPLTPQDLLARLGAHYVWANRHKFAGVLPDVSLRLNGRLRALTGRIFYDHRIIEISAFHLAGPDAWDVAQGTLEHEMLHLYLDVKGLPAGHTPTFKRLAKELAIPVWHARTYPRNRPPAAQHLYECPACQQRVVRTRRLSETQRSACGACCRAHGDGRFDERFVMRLVKSMPAAQRSVA